MILRAAVSAVVALFMSGCVLPMDNQPRNTPLTGAAPLERGEDSLASSDDMLIVLAFSGGGTRAAAFAHGVLHGMKDIRVSASGPESSMLDRIDFLSGVSGGSVTAAYYGLHGRSGLEKFREKFLLRNAEETLSTNMDLLNVSKAMAGGVNSGLQFSRWLDANVFHGATFRDMRAQRRPRVWINASDIYNHTPFIFGQTAFSAMCSDVASYPVANAVAASAAVPLVFTPMVIKTYPGECKTRLPDWVQKANADANAPPMLRAFSKAVTRYHDGSMKYIKLLDGGLVDNYGLAGFTLSRLSSNTAYEPMQRNEAARLRRVLFLVVDAGRAPKADWVNTVEGPVGFELVMSAADTAVDASVRAGFTALDSTMTDWENQLIRWRCGLSAAERAKLGAPGNWNCRDLKFFVGRVSFDQLDAGRAAMLQNVPTRLRLPADQVDLLIDAGAEAVRTNSTVQSFIQSLPGGARFRNQVAAR